MTYLQLQNQEAESWKQFLQETHSEKHYLHQVEIILPMRQSQNKDDPNSNRFDYRRKGFMKIKTMNLMKSLGYQSSFEPVNGTISIFLYPENPFTANSLPIRR